jgi:hypothetical protein
MSHANLISQLNQHKNGGNDLENLTKVCRDMTYGIETQIAEFVRIYDPSDVSLAPHALSAQLNRWAYIPERIATHHKDPASALKLSFDAVSSWTDEYDYAAKVDWDAKTRIYLKEEDEEPTTVTNMDAEEGLYVARDISNPRAVLQEAITIQKDYGLQARDIAVRTFSKLANQFPAQGLAFLDNIPQEESDKIQNCLSDTLDLRALKSELAGSMQSESVLHTEPLVPGNL